MYFPIFTKTALFSYVSCYIFLEGELSDSNGLRWAEIKIEYVQ
jgi:hypothetical protein